MPCDHLEGWGGVGWEVGGSFKREGAYVHLWLIHVDAWQKPTQYRKSMMDPAIKNKFKANRR